MARRTIMLVAVLLGLCAAPAGAAVSDGGCVGDRVTLTISGGGDGVVLVTARPGTGAAVGQVEYESAVTAHTLLVCDDLKTVAIVGSNSGNDVALTGEPGGPPLEVDAQLGDGSDFMAVEGLVDSVVMTEAASDGGNDTLVVTAEPTPPQVLGLNADLGSGNDRVIVRNAAGTYHGGDDDDWIDFSGAPSGVTVTLTADNEGDAGGLHFDGAESVMGSTHDDTLNGSTAADGLYGNLGNDTISAGAGADVLRGGDGDDTLIGGAGGDDVDGELGLADVASYEDRNTGVTFTVPNGPAGEGDTFSNIDIWRGSTGNDTITGTNGDNQLEGAGGDDTIDGALGADQIRGGPGSDTVDYHTRNPNITATLDTATGNGQAAENDGLFAIENISGGSGQDTLTGNDGDNTLNGNGQIDTLVGKGGADTLNGGAADDTIKPGAGAGSVDGGAGTNTISFDDLAGPDGVKVDLVNLTARVPNTLSGVDLGVTNVAIIGGSPVGDELIGDGGANLINGLAGNDTVDGGAGTDGLVGGGGVDTITYASHTAAVTVSLDGVANDGDPTGPENDALSGFAKVIGGAGGDTLIGDGFANVLDGGAGDDTLQGLDGKDTLVGGGGTDKASYAERGALDPVNVTLPTGGGRLGENDEFTTVEGVIGGDGGDTVSAVAALAGGPLIGGKGNDTLTGSSFADTIEGGDANDTVLGLEGVDTLTGGDGVDTVSYAGEPAERAVTLTMADGNGGPDGDTGETATEFENAIGSGGGDHITGTSAANVLKGNDGDDELTGGGGADTLQGDDDNDTLKGGADNDTIQGNDDADTLSGDDGDDVIDGGDHDDALDGGDGADALIGGIGHDRVTYANAADAVAVTLDNLANDGAAAEGDLVVAVEDVTGSKQGDRLVGNQGVNALDGGLGDDTVIGGRGDDNLDGGDGKDVISYEDRSASLPVSVDLAAGTGGGQQETDTLANFEVLIGGAASDTLRGGPADDEIGGAAGADLIEGAAGADKLGGGDGDDTLNGGDGDDNLDGGIGNDTINGAAGTDTFFGGDGDDTLDSADTVAENVDCGAGQDIATHDVPDILRDCEERRTPSAGEIPAGVVPLTPLGARDRDGDGFVSALECNDLEVSIHPGAADPPGDAIDQDCDGVDTPYPAIGTRLDSRFKRVKGGMRVVRALLRGVPAGVTIRVTCTSPRKPRCPFSTRTRTPGTARATYTLRGLFGDRILSTNARIEVRVETRTAVGRVITLQLRPTGSPTRIEQCLPPGAAKGVPC